MDEVPRRSRHAAALSDEQLALLVTAGESEEFSVLYERYRDALYRYCRSMLRNDADVHDVVQSTFARAFDALRRGRRDAPVRPWLFRIAHNEAVSAARRQRARDELSARLEPHTVAAADRGSERERFEALLGDLDELPERQRGAIIMRELNGLSHREIAVALGVSVTAAKQSIFEARKALTEFTEGRAMTCMEIRRAISEGDRRTLRRRRVRAHLRDCAACAAFAAAMPSRKEGPRALAPTLGIGSAAGVLARLFGFPRKGVSGTGSGVSAGVEGGTGVTIATKAAVGLAVLVGAGGLTGLHLGLRGRSGAVPSIIAASAQAAATTQPQERGHSAPGANPSSRRPGRTAVTSDGRMSGSSGSRLRVSKPGGPALTSSTASEQTSRASVRSAAGPGAAPATAGTSTSAQPSGSAATGGTNGRTRRASARSGQVGGRGSGRDNGYGTAPARRSGRPPQSASHGPSVEGAGTKPASTSHSSGPQEPGAVALQPPRDPTAGMGRLSAPVGDPAQLSGVAGGKARRS